MTSHPSDVSPISVTQDPETGLWTAVVTTPEGRVVTLPGSYKHRENARYDAYLVLVRPSKGWATSIRHGMRGG